MSIDKNIIAEKFEAFASLGIANSRYKDFYDIYILALSYDLNGNELKKAVMDLIQELLTPIIESITNETDFNRQWCKNSGHWD